MTIADDLAKIAVQELDLQFEKFDPEVAWQLGMRLRELAVARNHPVVIDVRRFGQVLFFCALPGTAPDNEEWVRRKTNTVARFLRSSYAIGQDLQRQDTNLTDKYALADADYAAHGGSFPIAVTGAGVLGAVTVSGLAQRADHELVVEALCDQLGRRYDDYRL